MLRCLILYHTTVSSLTKIKITRFIFKDEQFEINAVQNNTVIVYVWNMDKITILQLAADFERADIKVGHGYGKIKDEARRVAEEKLQKRLLSNQDFSITIHERMCPYRIRQKTS